VFPSDTKRLHAGFDDPPALARDVDSDEEASVIYRRVRDEIRAFIETLPEGLEEPASTAG
jgi:arsenate reductase